MTKTIANHLLSGLLESTNAKDFFDVVEKKYQMSDNADIARLMSELSNLRYDEIVGVREFILEMIHLQSKLKTYEIILPDNFAIYQALLTLRS